MIVSRTLFTEDPLLELVSGIGQQVTSFRFDLLDGVTGQPLAELNPIRSASLSHNTSQTTKRRLTLPLGVRDTALIDPINNRVDVTMLLSDGTEHSLGRYVFMDFPKQQFTSGELSVGQLTDEMIIVDQQAGDSVDGYNTQPEQVINTVLAPFTFPIFLDASPFYLSQSWGPSAYRGQILEAVALTGDYFSPWFGNDRAFHMIRAFDPATAVPRFNFDVGNQVLRETVNRNNDALIAPNRFVVTSNSSQATGIGSVAIMGKADVPDSAPHSARNRGFVVSDFRSLPVQSSGQATAVARNLALRQQVAETLTLSTAIDPRHDSYDVVMWRGEKWLELSWSMTLVAGGTMNHTLRRSYT